MTGIAGSPADRVLLQLAERFDQRPSRMGRSRKIGLTSITSGDGSFLTPRRRKADSNSRSLAGLGPLRAG
jgi:hypothetical protein